MSKNIQIVIPTCNDRDRLERTLQSIREQTYDQERIYLVAVDFASTDGTYELLLSYVGNHVGVYRKMGQIPQERMIAEIAELSQYLWPEGYDGLYLVLYPGEVLYANALEVCMREYEKHGNEDLAILLCEADIWEYNGNIHTQKKLFAQSRNIWADETMHEYTCRGYNHQIAMFTPFLFTRNRRDGVEMNEQRWWNKCSQLCSHRNALYISQAIGCVNRVEYEDEAEEILLRWESVIAQIRRGKLDETFRNESMNNLAWYALWRSFILYEKHGFGKEVEDCFLLSPLIFSDIEKTEQYQNIKKLFYNNNIECLEDIRARFRE